MNCNGEGVVLERATWLIIAAVGAVAAVWVGTTDFALEPSGAAVPVLAFAGVSALIVVYRRWRPDRRIAGTLTSVAQLIAFTAVGALLSYLVASCGGPLWDAPLHQWDLALGLDWRDYLAWVNGNPALGVLFSAAYQSLTLQMIVLTLCLGFTGQMLKMRMVVHAIVLSGVATILISGLMPAMAYYVHLGLQTADYPNLSPAAARVHVAHLQGLRDGSLLLLSLSSLEGIITFPSYHAALGVILAYGCWAVPLLRWPGLVLNAVLIAATPIDGGHYFVDVIAGGVIAACSIQAAKLFGQRSGLTAAAGALASWSVQTRRVGGFVPAPVSE